MPARAILGISGLPHISHYHRYHILTTITTRTAIHNNVTAMLPPLPRLSASQEDLVVFFRLCHRYHAYHLNHSDSTKEFNPNYSPIPSNPPPSPDTPITVSNIFETASPSAISPSSSSVSSQSPSASARS